MTPSQLVSFFNLAVYNDEIVREADGVRRFSRRSYVYRYLDDSPFTGEVFPLTAPLDGASAAPGAPR